MLSPVPEAGSVIGIDVGFSQERRSSAICRLSWDQASVRWSASRFRALEPERARTIALVAGEGHVLAAAFDGPLRGEFDIIGTYRAAERMLTRRLGRLIGKPGQSSAPVGLALNAHANMCALRLFDCGVLREASHAVAIHQLAICEAFPSSFMGVMIPEPSMLNVRRKTRSDLYYQHLSAMGTFSDLLHHFLPGRTCVSSFDAVTDHDERAAVVCALTALSVVGGDCAAVGDRDGWIVLPPRCFIQPWASAMLEANNSEERICSLHISQPGREPKV